MRNRQQELKSKSYNMVPATEPYIYEQNINTDFSKLKVGTQTLTDAIIDYGVYKKIDNRCGDKKNVLQAIHERNYNELREISNFFYETSGIYNRLCRYMAFLYRYDWMITPYISDDKANDDKVLLSFHKALTFLDSFNLKMFCGDVALKVLKDGAYYGYVVKKGEKMSVQELPPKYCRSRFSVDGRPVVEFNMKYFDDSFRDTAYRLKILKAFPQEFAKGYLMYREGKLKPEFAGDTNGWYMLTPGAAIKFNLNGSDFPAFASVIPSIIDLDEAKELDKKRIAQKLLRIVIQKMPIDKNGDLIFDPDEARELHNNAVHMLRKSIGLDVLTTFADVDVADMSDSTSANATDDLQRVERAVYNEAGVSQNQFNTDGNLALEKSILNDEASMYNLILQLEQFFNDMIQPFSKNKKITLKFQMLTTTIYNYKEMAKLYKEQTQLGYSKMLPQIALGQSQSSILANAHFENDILDLVNIFIPPISSSTMNADMLNKTKSGESGEVGRKEKEDDQKSEKTIQNRESMS